MASVTSLDHDMRKLRMQRYTPSAANEVKSWIEETLGERLQGGDLLDSLRDGVALCKLVNLALPPPGIKYKASNMPFTQRENISQFLTACERPPFNMPSHDRFLTVDLYDGKDPAQVIQCIGAFSRQAHNINLSKFHSVIGPKRGAPSPTRKTADGSSHTTANPSTPARGQGPSQWSAQSPNSTAKSPPTARMMSPTLTGGSTGSRTPESARGPVSSWTKKTDEGITAPAWNIHQYGYMGGASQGNQGVVFGAPRQITQNPVYVPSSTEKQARLRERELEAEREAQQRREDEQQRARERQAQIEAEEEQARRDEQRRWEEEERKARLREQEDAERQRREQERERDELRQAREQERQAVERDKEERRRREEQRKADEEHARREADASRNSARDPAPLAAQNTSESQRIQELERQLAEAKERERQWKQQQDQTSQLRQPSTQTTASQDSVDESFTAGDEAAFNAPTPPRQVPMRSGGPRPPPALASKPSVAPKPRNTPFTRPNKPADIAQAEVRPPAPLGATAEPPADDTAPSPNSSSRPAHVTRTDQYLSSNPAPTESQPASHMSEEIGMSSTSERDAEDARRAASQQKTKASGWASKSLLEREMERERERQREWEESQMAKARAAPNGRIMGPRAMGSRGT